MARARRGGIARRWTYPAPHGITGYGLLSHLVLGSRREGERMKRGGEWGRGRDDERKREKREGVCESERERENERGKRRRREMGEKMRVNEKK